MSTRPPREMWLAPGAPSSSASFPGREAPPRATDHVVLGEDIRKEVVDGVVYDTMGADPTHAVPHFSLPRLLGTALRDEYVGAVDLLARVNKPDEPQTEFAPDVSIFAREQLALEREHVDEIAIELKDSTRRGELTRKAKHLSARGVRRIFAIDVRSRSFSEWDHARQDWTLLPRDFVLRDPVFVADVPLAALFDQLAADAAVVNALAARGDPALAAMLAKQREDALTEGRQEGRQEGLGALSRVYERRLGRPLTEAERDELLRRLAALGPARLGDVVLDLDPEALAAWIAAPDAR